MRYRHSAVGSVDLEVRVEVEDDSSEVEESDADDVTLRTYNEYGDELYWNVDEKKFLPRSKEEIERLDQQARHSNARNLRMFMKGKAVRDAERAAKRLTEKRPPWPYYMLLSDYEDSDEEQQDRSRRSRVMRDGQSSGSNQTAKQDTFEDLVSGEANTVCISIIDDASPRQKKRSLKNRRIIRISVPLLRGNDSASKSILGNISRRKSTLRRPSPERQLQLHSTPKTSRVSLRNISSVSTIGRRTFREVDDDEDDDEEEGEEESGKKEAESSSQMLHQTHSERRGEHNDTVLAEASRTLPYYLHGCSGQTDLERLVHVAGQQTPLAWDDVLSPDVLSSVSKLNEGSYGEIFEATINGQQVVMKVQKMVERDEDRAEHEESQRIKKVMTELVIAREVTKLDSTSCFISLLGAHVIKGEYPAQLLKAFDSFKRRNKKQALNERPSKFHSPDALYLVMVQQKGGTSVEEYKVRNKHVAVSAIVQICYALMVAEHELKFEHRDLHNGNVLIEEIDDEKEEIEFILGKKRVRVISHGVRVGIIDYTLSRIEKNKQSVYFDLSEDEELFNQKVETVQTLLYDEMKDHTGNKWPDFYPRTNVIWAHYMARELLLPQSEMHKMTHDKKAENRRDAKGFENGIRDKLWEVFDKLLEYKTISAFINENAKDLKWDCYVKNDAE